MGSPVQKHRLAYSERGLHFSSWNQVIFFFFCLFELKLTHLFG